MLAPAQNGLREANDLASTRASETDAKTFAVRVQEMLDSLEVDLAAMIRDVQAACDGVRHGIRSSSTALSSIRTRSEQLAGMSREARQGASELAGATEDFAKSSGEIDQQIRRAGELTAEAGEAAGAAAGCVDGLKSSSAEIGNV